MQLQYKGRQSGFDFSASNRSPSLGSSVEIKGSQNNMNTHNPVTNPIDFKIGITNPYVIK